MATKKVNEIKEETVKKDNNKETEQLKKEIELLKQQLMSLKDNTVDTQPQQKKNNKKTIKFINMTVGSLVLQGNRFHNFEGQFTSKNISESEAVAILQNMPDTINNGMVYIADAQFIKDYDLEDVYENILSDKSLKQLLNKDANSVYEVYLNSNDAQKQIILNMVIDKQLNKQAIDANILTLLSKECGQNLLDIADIDD